MHRPGEYQTITELDLSDDQIRTIEEKTGLKVSSLEVLSTIVTGEAARTRDPNAEAGILLVACW
jgi:hypothetical protein